MKTSIQLNQPSWVAIVAIVIVASLAILLVLPKRVQTDRLPPSETTVRSLFDQAGGKDAIVALVEETISRISTDQRINSYFAKIDLARLKSLLAELICELLKGPCKYSGRNMKEAHIGLGITSSDFAYLMDDLTKALDSRHTPAAVKREILHLFERMKLDVVEKE